jgi:teichuronic acid biosynthesis glycosyltransferase TuaG
LTASLEFPLVSIIIPTYNHAHFLKETLTCVVNQSYINWEVIIVNNYSEDETESVVASFNDQRIKLINFSNNGIIAASRNYGINQAEGTYIAFLDSDDLWSYEKLERCVNFLISSKCDWVCHSERWFGDDFERNVVYGPEGRASFDALLYRGNCISTSAVVIKRALLSQVQGFSELSEIVTAEDYDLWLRLAQLGAKVHFIDEILGSYRIHSQGQSQAALRNMSAISAVVERVFSSIPPKTIYERLRRRARRGGVFYQGARALQNQSNHWQAWPLFFKAVWCSPFDKRIFPAMIMNALGLRF